MTALRLLCFVGIHPRRGFAFIGDGWNDIWIRVCRECGRQMFDREAERAYAELDRRGAPTPDHKPSDRVVTTEQEWLDTIEGPVTKPTEQGSR